LNRELVGSVETRELLTGLNELVFAARAESPEILQVADSGRGYFDGRLKLKKRSARKTFKNGGNDQPGDDDEAEQGKRFGLIKTFSGHERRGRCSARERRGKGRKVQGPP
jgi:hypothetical protein